jgi:hypothetical protein
LVAAGFRARSSLGKLDGEVMPWDNQTGWWARRIDLIKKGWNCQGKVSLTLSPFDK